MMTYGWGEGGGGGGLVAVYDTGVPSRTRQQQTPQDVIPYVDGEGLRFGGCVDVWMCF